MQYLDLNAFSVYSLRKKASNKITFCGGVSFWLLPYGKAFSWGIVHFNAFSSVLFEKNASNKLTSGGGGQFLACRSHKIWWNMIKLSLKYHQNTIKISSKHVGTRQKIKLQFAEGGPPPFRKCFEFVDVCGHPGGNCLPIWEKSKTDPPGGPQKM